MANKTRKSLVEYINSSGIQFSICEDRDWKQGMQGATFTDFQELLTCVCFDLAFNQNKNWRSQEDLASAVLESRSLLEEVGNVSKIKNFADAAEAIFETASMKRGADADAKLWMKSFYFQCVTFFDFLNTHPNLPASDSIAFMQHNTGVAVRNGQVLTGFKPLAQRVESGKPSGAKDNYQKADIYAIWEYEDGSKPLDDVLSEISYWSTAAVGNNKEAKFIGISLKQIKKSYSNVKIFNLCDTEEIMHASSAKFIMTPFRGVYFNSEDDLSAGEDNLTAYLDFDLVWGNEKLKKRLNIRSSGKGDEHIDKFGKDPESTAKVSVKYRGPFDFYAAGTAVELQTLNSTYRDGKIASTINQIAKEADIKKGKNAMYTSTEYKATFERVSTMCQEYGLEMNVEKPTAAACKLMDWLLENDRLIRDVFARYENGERTPELREKVLMYARAIKWKVIIQKQLYYLEAIMTYVARCWAETRDNGILFSKEGQLFMTLAEFTHAAKGITKDALPYLMLAQ